MTLYDYALLSPEEQADATWKHGAFIAVGDMGPTKVLLYQLQSFYVEVYYNCERGEIERFRYFDSVDHLEPYLAAIDLSDLLPLVRLHEPVPQATPGFRTRLWRTLHKLFPLTVVMLSFIVAFYDQHYLYL